MTSTRKSQNLAADARCTFAISLGDLDLVLEGTAVRVTDPVILARIAERYTERGWSLTVAGDLVTAPFWAPTAPAPPWHLYAFHRHHRARRRHCLPRRRHSLAIHYA